MLYEKLSLITGACISVVDEINKPVVVRLVTKNVSVRFESIAVIKYVASVLFSDETVLVLVVVVTIKGTVGSDLGQFCLNNSLKLHP